MTVTVTDAGGLSVVRTFVVTVVAVADTPLVSNATTDEDTPVSLTIARNPVDGAEVTHFKILSVTGGTLFQATAPPRSRPARSSRWRKAWAAIHAGTQCDRDRPRHGAGLDWQHRRRSRRRAGDHRHHHRPDRRRAVGHPGDDGGRHADDVRPGDHAQRRGRPRGHALRDHGDHPRVAVPERRHDADLERAGDQFAQGNAGLRFTPAPNFFGAAGFVSRVPRARPAPAAARRRPRPSR